LNATAPSVRVGFLPSKHCNVLPAGDINFTYWLLQRPMTRLLTAQESVSRWMQALLPLFEEKLAGPAAPPPGKNRRGTVEDLQDKASARSKPKAIPVCAPT